MIWDIIEESTFDDHFKKQSLSLQELLVDQNILTEMKNLNPSLLLYLETNIDTVIDQLITYITTIPDSSETYDRCYKLPYISSEMLAIDNDLFYTAFLGKVDHSGHSAQGGSLKNLQKLFRFLQNAQTVENELLMGYFLKVTNNLHKGRKLEFSEAVMSHSDLFLKNLGKESIGTILSKCLVLIETQEGKLLAPRIQLLHKIVAQLETIQNQSSLSPSDIKQFEVGSSILIEVIGKYKTYSSGEELVNNLFGCEEKATGQNSHILKLLRLPEEQKTAKLRQSVYNLMIGILTATKQKIYDPQTDAYQFIFKYPLAIQKRLNDIVIEQLPFCQKSESMQLESIPFQNKQSVKPISMAVFSFFKIVSSLLDNKISSFLQQTQYSFDLVDFIFCIYEKHPKNDVLLVNLDKVLEHIIKENAKKLEFVNQVQIHQKMMKVYSLNPQMYRPHFYQIWSSLKSSGWKSPSQSQQWDKMNSEFQYLEKLYSDKAVVTQIQRSKDTKLIIDEEDIITKAVENDHQKMSKSAHSHVATEIAHEVHEKQVKESSKQTKKENGFDAFNDFAAFSGTKSESKEKKKETKLDFSDFMKF